VSAAMDETDEFNRAARANVVRYPGAQAGPASLMVLLARDGQQRVLPTLANALHILAMDPALDGLLAYDEFSERLLITRAPPAPRQGDYQAPGPYPRPWRAEDVALIQAYLQQVWSHRFSRQTVEEAMPVEARRHHIHPVRDWLADLKWDGRERLNGWLRQAFGCPDDPYHAAAGAKMLIASVRRIRRPGCKFDHTPVFEGSQGLGKSSALRRLYGDDWFSDALPDDLAGKDAAMALNGVWCLELAELQQIIRSEPATVKAFLTRQVDRYRPPYGKVYVERPRQTIICGTTNDEEWLSDATGNRRFWPIACRHVEGGWIDDHRGQLWAEAAAREAAGETHWLDGEEARAGAVEAQASRLIEDAWGDKVRDYLADGRVRVTAAQVLDALNIPTAQQNKAAQMRVAAIMRATGWRKERTNRSRFWTRQEDENGGSHSDDPAL